MESDNFLDRIRKGLGLTEPAVKPATAPGAPVPTQPPVTDLSDARIPQAARDRIMTIGGLIDDLEARVAAKGAMAEERVELEQIQSVHLPRLLKSYIDIPAQHRAEIFRSTGRSASYLLTERLDKMIERLGEISRMLAQGDLDAFASNIRFIDTRYGAPGTGGEWD